jgi:hypothetical protein
VEDGFVVPLREPIAEAEFCAAARPRDKPKLPATEASSLTKLRRVKSIFRYFLDRPGLTGPADESTAKTVVRSSFADTLFL